MASGRLQNGVTPAWHFPLELRRGVCYYGRSSTYYAHKFAAPLSHLIGALFY
jgi:hypothetical protein